MRRDARPRRTSARVENKPIEVVKQAEVVETKIETVAAPKRPVSAKKKKRA